MRLIIQVPCYNEEQTLPVTLRALPRRVEGFSSVEWLVVDDGSDDRTVEIARSEGVDYVVRLRRHLGLAKAFRIGLEACLASGADVIVNTDADNQYCADDIPGLVRPILERTADVVVGARGIDAMSHLSRTRRTLQKLGSWAVRWASSTSVTDAPSGFRALSRDAATRINVFDPYTYTLEMLIQAGQKGLRVASVPVRVNAPLRRSRLVRSVPDYVVRSTLTIVRMFVVYRPFRFFALMGACLLFVGVTSLVVSQTAFARSHGDAERWLLFLSAIGAGLGAQALLAGLIADIVGVNRRLIEDVQYRLRRIENRPEGSVESVESGCAELLRLEPAGATGADRLLRSIPSFAPRQAGRSRASPDDRLGAL
jgi:glycosyltransferase involved in cell wall biosynthesis